MLAWAGTICFRGNGFGFKGLGLRVHGLGFKGLRAWVRQWVQLCQHTNKLLVFTKPPFVDGLLCAQLIGISKTVDVCGVLSTERS